MAPPKGNEFWKLRSSFGHDPKFANGEELWKACCEYFEWNAANPLYEHKPFAYEGRITMARVPKMRAMTLVGLCMFLGVDQVTWQSWRRDRKDLIPVIKVAEDIVYRQKFEGASAGMLNANIIARDLGLAEKTEQTSTVNLTVSPEDAAL